MVEDYLILAPRTMLHHTIKFYLVIAIQNHTLN